MQQQGQRQSQRVFTASELAQFEYCSLSWWYETFEPLVYDSNEELLARMVEIEDEYGTQATAMPEYQLIEKLLVRRGGFEKGRRQHQDYAEDLNEVEEERVVVPAFREQMRRTLIMASVVILLALILIVIAIIQVRQ